MILINFSCNDYEALYEFVILMLLAYVIYGSKQKVQEK